VTDHHEDTKIHEDHEKSFVQKFFVLSWIFVSS